MKVKLLKKLRKEAHDAYRIVPGDEGTYTVQVYTNMWDDERKWLSTLQEAIAYLDDCRKTRFIQLADKALFERRVKKLSKY